MGVEVFGLEQTMFGLRRTADRVPKHSLETIRSYSKKMVKRAKEYAPIKDGFLEESIQVLPEIKEFRGRVSVVWGVNVKLLGPGYRKYRFRYDIKMEKGDFHSLGRRSLQKAETYDVGEMFMMRATWDFEEAMVEAISNQAVRNGL